ncbi:hypothetical protein BJ138DRAFT_1112281 [Hygrophoropsis aurantiaca]|uniref:Uncharacterized protein n=1 Tax=Hygrophoropsis aurantiaca TaxID=72124 RepID=A0ACB8AH26_9AGAM|nr:hypothetical protein BJ138DRAFT_1112281 [Hygrophoropsis aurantiaca]
MALTLSEAELAGTLIQSVLFGAYIVLFIACIYVLLFARGRQQRGNKLRRRRPVNTTLFTISIILFILITSHWFISFARLFPAFIYDVHGVGSSYEYLVFAGNPIYVAKTALYVAQMVVGDITMVYRLYVVWGHSWRVIIAPVVTTAALLTAGTGAVYSFARIQKGEEIFADTSGRWIATVFATSVTYKWSQLLPTFHAILNWLYTHRSLTKVITIVVESAAIYTVYLTITHVSYLTGTVFSFSALDVTSPAIGIAFSLIIVRVGLGWATEGDRTTASGSRVPTNLQPIAFAPMAVHVTREINTDGTVDTEEGTASKRNWSSDLLNQLDPSSE